MKRPKPSLSFEFFPPKTALLEEALLKATRTLAPFNPHFVSVTYGAGGSTRDRTHKIVMQLQDDFKLATAPHLTCIGATQDDIAAIAEHYWQHGVRHLVALRGDPPDEGKAYRPLADGYAYASDLVAGLCRLHPFKITVAAYPETHPEALNAAADLANLKRKMQAGASQAITQFFLDTEAFLRFRDKAAQAGITMPIIPGILPISNFARASEFARMCGASIPAAVAARFAGLAAGTPEHQAAALRFAEDQIDRLRREGAQAFHFYTLNRADLVVPLCRRLTAHD